MPREMHNSNVFMLSSRLSLHNCGCEEGSTMIPKWAQQIIPVIAILSITPTLVMAHGQQHLSRAELRRFMANANNPAAYQELAAYFHYQQQVYRAKADAEMDDYANCVRNVTMAPKFPTRADQDDRLYEYYSAKADQQAKLAAHYDELLTKSGSKPAGDIHIVSLTDLERHAQEPGASSLLVQKSQAAHENSSPHERQ